MHDLTTQLLGVLIILDIAYGTLMGIIQHQFNSSKMKMGIATHALIFFALVFATLHSSDLAQWAPTVAWVKLAFITMYASSIVETYIAGGGQLPTSVANKFKVYNDKDKDKEK